MARSTVNYQVADEGRDFGKLFVITEMSASQAESWAMRALLALMKHGAEVPPGFERLGVAGMAELGFKALSRVQWADLEPLMAELMACVTIIPDPGRPQIVRPLIEQDIEEVTTRIKIKTAVWKLHTDFLRAVAPSILGAVAQGAAGKPAS